MTLNCHLRVHVALRLSSIEGIWLFEDLEYSDKHLKFLITGICIQDRPFKKTATGALDKSPWDATNQLSIHTVD